MSSLLTKKLDKPPNYLRLQPQFIIINKTDKIKPKIMIQANELRIGNLVTIENKKSWPNLSGKPMKVIGIEERLDRRFPKSRHTVKLEEYSQFEEFISSIPLTPEILERCGFEKMVNILNLNDYWFLAKESGDFYLQVERHDDFESICERLHLNHIKYLHQLQNLYFALTGYELEIKELQTA